MVRIIAGKWRGRTIVAPTGQATRPTSDRTREALFSMLASRVGSFEGLEVADIFAGSGALGLEALSRGAARCTFIEQDATTLRALRANLAKLRVDLAVADVRPGSALHSAGGPFDLLLIDPPYRSGDGLRALAAASAAPNAWASLETARDESVTPPPGWKPEAERIHGKAKLTLLRYDG